MERPVARRRGWLTLGLALCVLALPLVAAAQDAEPEGAAASTPRIYRWIDENGIAHYTTEPGRIPAALRGRLGGLSDTSPGAAVGGTSDAWASRDRAVAPDPEGWYEDGDVPHVDPEVQEEQREERAVALFDIDLRIAELENVIREDEDALKTMVSDPNSGGPLASDENEAFKTIAMRLPQRLKELRSLRDQRAALRARDEGAE